MANIEIKNVIKKFGDVTALDGLSFNARDGEMFCLLGPSGAGKTTTLRIISGIETPDSGDVVVDGQSIVNLMAKERDVALAFESYALYPQLTVAQNLAFPLEAPIRKKEYTTEAKKKRVQEVAELLNISELLERYPRELSGGQRQRVGLGRVLVRKPKLYLLDEPIAHLDAKLRHRMRGELKKIQTDLGITTLYSTPDQLEALSMADTIALINKGKIEQVGSPDQLFGTPANTFVAKFVGDPPMNIFDARVDDGKIVVECDVNFQFPIPQIAPINLIENLKEKRLQVGIRPKDISLHANNYPSAHTKAQVIDVETLGQTSIVFMKVGCLEIKAKVDTETTPAAKDLVSLVLDTDQLHYFRTADCTRIS